MSDDDVRHGDVKQPSDQQIVASIKEILAAGNLAELTLKKVIRALSVKHDCDLTSRKREIDAMLLTEINAMQKNGNKADTSSDESDSDGPADAPPPYKKANSSTKNGAAKGEDASASSADEEIDDEKVAREMHSSLNERSMRHRKDTSKKSKPQKERKKPMRAGGSAYSRECVLSEDLAAVMGTERMPRHEVVKRMWAIFRERNMMDPKNKQWVICDQQLERIFKVPKFKAFGMMKYLKHHIKDADLTTTSDANQKKQAEVIDDESD